MKKYVRVPLADNTTSTECGDCDHVYLGSHYRWCRLFDDRVGVDSQQPLRIPECVAAEVCSDDKGTSDV